MGENPFDFLFMLVATKPDSLRHWMITVSTKWPVHCQITAPPALTNSIYSAVIQPLPSETESPALNDHQPVTSRLLLKIMDSCLDYRIGIFCRRLWSRRWIDWWIWDDTRSRSESGTIEIPWRPKWLTRRPNLIVCSAPLSILMSLLLLRWPLVYWRRIALCKTMDTVSGKHSSKGKI